MLDLLLTYLFLDGPIFFFLRSSERLPFKEFKEFDQRLCICIERKFTFFGYSKPFFIQSVMVVIVNVHIVEVFLQPDCKDKLHELVPLLLRSVEVKIYRIDVLHNVCDRFDGYLDQRLLRLTDEVDLSSIDPNGLLHDAYVTVVHLALLVVERLVKERQIKAENGRIRNCVVKLKLYWQNIVIGCLLQDVRCVLIARQHLLRRLRELLVPFLDLVILTLLLLLEHLLSNSYIFLFFLKRSKIVLLRLQILPVIRVAFHGRLEVTVDEE